MKVMYKFLITAVCCIPVQAFAVDKLTVPELLDRLTASQDKLRSLIAKTEDIIINTQSNRPTPTFSREVADVSVDRKRVHHRWYRWLSLAAKDAPTPIEDAECFFKLWDGKRYIEYYKPLKAEDKRIAYISADERNAKYILISGGEGAPFLGVRFSDFERIDAVLRQADSISVRDELEQVGSVACYIIDAKAKSGTYTVWLDPEHGYSIAKADVHLGPNDSFGRRLLKDNESNSLSIRNVRFENINGVWLPMEADLYMTSDRQGSPSVYATIHHKVTQITLDPDHDTLGSFIPQIENGTRVRDLDFGILYTWQDGKLIADIDESAVKQIDKMTEDLRAEGKVPARASATKKTEAAPDEQAETEDTQADISESQTEALSESRLSPVLVLIPIGLLAIAVIAWRVFLLKRK